MTIIDGHAHAALALADADGIGETLDRLGVDKVALCPSPKNNTGLKTPERAPIPLLVPSAKYFAANRGCRLAYALLLRDRGDGNRFVRGLARKHPYRILQFYWLDPQEADAVAKLKDALRSWPIHGIKLHQACHTFQNDGPVMHRVAGLAGERGLPIFIHPYSPREVQRLLDLAARHRQTTFILAHLLGLEIAAADADALKNVFYDVSGGDSVITPKRLQLALEAFGAERLIFGSDEPFGSFAASLARVRALSISAAQKERILGGNLSRLCRLRDASDSGVLPRRGPGGDAAHRRAGP